MSPVSTLPGRERLVRDDALQEGDVGRDADDLVLGERLGEPPQRRRPILAVDDQLGDHRIVVRRDLVAGAHAGVHAHRRRRSPAPRRCDERADRRQEAAVRILGVDARLDRVTAKRELVLPLRQRLARRDPQLPFDEVLAR